MIGNFMYAAYLMSRFEEYVCCIDAKEFLTFLEKSCKNHIVTGYYIVKYNDVYKFVVDTIVDPYDFSDKEIIEKLYSYDEWLNGTEK